MIGRRDGSKVPSSNPLDLRYSDSIHSKMSPDSGAGQRHGPSITSESSGKLESSGSSSSLIEHEVSWVITCPSSSGDSSAACASSVDGSSTDLFPFLVVDLLKCIV